MPDELPDAAKEDPDPAVLVLQCRTLSTAAEHLELMTEGDVLKDQRIAGAKRSSDQLYDEAQHLERLTG